MNVMYGRQYGENDVPEDQGTYDDSPQVHNPAYEDTTVSQEGQQGERRKKKKKRSEREGADADPERSHRRRRRKKTLEGEQAEPGNSNQQDEGNDGAAVNDPGGPVLPQEPYDNETHNPSYEPSVRYHEDQATDDGSHNPSYEPYLQYHEDQVADDGSHDPSYEPYAPYHDDQVTGDGSEFEHGQSLPPDDQMYHGSDEMPQNDFDDWHPVDAPYPAGSEQGDDGQYSLQPENIEFELPAPNLPKVEPVKKKKPPGMLKRLFLSLNRKKKDKGSDDPTHLGLQVGVGTTGGGGDIGQMSRGSSQQFDDQWQANPDQFNPALDSFPHHPAGETRGDTGGRVTRKPESRHGAIARVVLLDGEEVSIELDKRAIGHELFARICNASSIVESDYFGITYVDIKVKTWFWLDMEKTISKQLASGEEWVFNFQVKFYPPEPSLLKEDITRYQLCQQIRQDIYTKKLPCSWVTQALLGSFTAQSELGDFDLSEHGTGIDYLRELEFIYNQTDVLLEKIAELHQSHKGMTPAEADLKYLETAKRLEQYGVDLHPARDMENVDIYIGVSHMGVVVYRMGVRIGRFAWPKVLRISYNKNYFYLKIRSDQHQEAEAQVGFRLFNNHLAKRLWKVAIENHTFFRLKEPQLQSKHKLPAPKMGSRYHYSGRTFFQYRTMNIDRPHQEFDRATTKRRSVGLGSMPFGLNATGGVQYGSMHSLHRAHPRDMTLGKTQSVECLLIPQSQQGSVLGSGINAGSKGQGSVAGDSRAARSQQGSVLESEGTIRSQASVSSRTRQQATPVPSESQATPTHNRLFVRHNQPLLSSPKLDKRGQPAPDQVSVGGGSLFLDYNDASSTAARSQMMSPEPVPRLSAATRFPAPAPRPTVAARTPEPAASYRSPEPAASYRSPEPAASYRSPEPAASYRSPELAASYRSPEPAPRPTVAARTPEPAAAYQSPEPAPRPTVAARTAELVADYQSPEPAPRVSAATRYPKLAPRSSAATKPRDPSPELDHLPEQPVAIVVEEEQFVRPPAPPPLAPKPKAKPKPPAKPRQNPTNALSQQQHEVASIRSDDDLL